MIVAVCLPLLGCEQNLDPEVDELRRDCRYGQSDACEQLPLVFRPKRSR